MCIFGEFNDWKRGEIVCKKNDFGCFETLIKANPDGTPRIPHMTKYKIQIQGADDSWMDRNSAWATMQM